jgi:osmoprotectant transport system ATP-binding protein
MLRGAPSYTPSVALELRNVSKSYDGGRTNAVDDVSFAAAPNELVVLVGESGCGKTTTLKTINRLIEATGGQVLVDGKDVAATDPVELRRSIGYVFQGIGLFPHMSVGRNVGIIPRLLGWDEGRISSRVIELLEMVHLDPGEYGARMPGELSGGQRQRVGFARALAAGPSLMLLDEPFGALDPITREELRTEFARIQHRLGLAAVLVTHDMTEALLMGDRIIVMRSGRIVREGSPGEMMRDPGDPYVARLIASPRHQALRLSEMADNDRAKP